MSIFNEAFIGTVASSVGKGLTEIRKKKNRDKENEQQKQARLDAEKRANDREQSRHERNRKESLADKSRKRKAEYDINTTKSAIKDESSKRKTNETRKYNESQKQKELNRKNIKNWQDPKFRYNQWEQGKTPPKEYDYTSLELKRFNSLYDSKTNKKKENSSAYSKYAKDSYIYERWSKLKSDEKEMYGGYQDFKKKHLADLKKDTGYSPQQKESPSAKYGWLGPHSETPEQQSQGQDNQQMQQQIQQSTGVQGIDFYNSVVNPPQQVNGIPTSLPPGTTQADFEPASLSPEQAQGAIPDGGNPLEKTDEQGNSVIDITPLVDPNALTADEENEYNLLLKYGDGTITPEEMKQLQVIRQKQLGL